MVHPEKWRDTIDPYSVPMTSFRITEVIGYPHARNDVFQVKGIYHGRKIDAYLKVARHEDSAIAHENALLKKINSPLLPTVIDSGTGEICFSVTEAMPGERLSNIVGDNNDLASLAYMEEYGAALASLHQLQVEADPVVDRRFFHQPSDEL